MDETINIASETLKELYYQREIIDKTLVQQTNIQTIYNTCQNVLKSMNDSFYRLFFKNKEIELETYTTNKNEINNYRGDIDIDIDIELQKIKQINLLINKELNYHNKILETSNKFKLKL